MGVEEIKWYRKEPIAINGKLVRAVMDALPFDMDYKTAKLVTQTVFDTIVEGVIRDGFVTITGLGKFFKRHRPSRRINSVLDGKQYKRRTQARDTLGFIPCRRLRNYHDEE